MSACHQSFLTAQSNCLPLLIYMIDGQLLKTYVPENNRVSSTVYHLPVKKVNNCYLLKPVLPIEVCGQTFLKKINITTIVNKSCISGLHLLTDATVVNDVTIQHTFNDCIMGNYSISKGFQHSTIWQSNINNYSGQVKVKYSNGEDRNLFINVKYKDDYKKDYMLFKNDAITIYLKNVNSVEIVKRNIESTVKGYYSINVQGKITERIKL